MSGDGGALPPPPLSVSVDLDHPTPPYEQIRGQIAAHLSAGALRPGDRLPTVRALAADLGVAVGTVSRAYRELEQEGAVTSRRRTGTVVSRDAPGTADRPAAPQPGPEGSQPERSGAGRSGAGRSGAERSGAEGAGQDGAADVHRPGRSAGAAAAAPRSADHLDGGPAALEPATTAVSTRGAPAPRPHPEAGSGPIDPAEGGAGPGGAGPSGAGPGGARPGGAGPSGRSGVAGLVAAADALAAAAVRAGVDDRDVLTLVSGALLLARRP